MLQCIGNANDVVVVGNRAYVADGESGLQIISPTTQNPPALVIRPWHQSGSVISIREFSNNPFNHHHGIQTKERFGRNTDLDGDGFTNEMTRSDVTAVSLYQAGLPVPGRVISRDPEVEEAVLEGEKTFEKIGCSRCHLPRITAQ